VAVYARCGAICSSNRFIANFLDNLQVKNFLKIGKGLTTPCFNKKGGTKLIAVTLLSSLYRFKKIFLTCRLSRKFAIKRLLLQIAPHLAYTATLPDVVLPDSSPSGCVTKREMIGRPRVCCLHTISDISPIQFNWNFTKAKGVETATCIEVKCKSWQ